VNRQIISDLWNKTGSVKNTVFHFIKSSHTKIQEQCKVLTIFNGLFSITYHTAATEPRDSYLSNPTKLKQSKNG